MARAARADGTNFARETAAELSRPLPAPLLPLSPRAEKYWPRIIGSKLISSWTETDLDTAWSLCEDLAKLEELRLILQTHPSIYKDGQGKFREHPAIKLVEVIERRIQATKRHIQINSAATSGPSHHQTGKNATARHLASVISDAGSDLIPRPR
jgi:hypothetical protein